MSATLLRFPAPRATAPIRVMAPERRAPPAPSIIGLVLVSVGIWWLVGYAIWRLI